MADLHQRTQAPKPRLGHFACLGWDDFKAHLGRSWKSWILGPLFWAGGPLLALLLWGSIFDAPPWIEAAANGALTVIGTALVIVCSLLAMLAYNFWRAPYRRVEAAATALAAERKLRRQQAERADHNSHAVDELRQGMKEQSAEHQRAMRNLREEMAERQRESRESISASYAQHSAAVEENRSLTNHAVTHERAFKKREADLLARNIKLQQELDRQRKDHRSLRLGVRVMNPDGTCRYHVSNPDDNPDLFHRLKSDEERIDGVTARLNEFCETAEALAETPRTTPHEWTEFWQEFNGFVLRHMAISRQSESIALADASTREKGVDVAEWARERCAAAASLIAGWLAVRGLTRFDLS